MEDAITQPAAAVTRVGVLRLIDVAISMPRSARRTRG